MALIIEEKVENLNRDMDIKGTTLTDHTSSYSTCPSSTTPPIEEKRQIKMQYEVKVREEPTSSTIKSKSHDEQVCLYSVNIKVWLGL